MQKLVLLFDKTIDIMAIISKLFIVFICLIVILDVFSLAVFNHSFNWVLEISEYSLVFLTFLGMTWLLREDGHVKFDLLIEQLPKKARAFLEIINSLLGLFIAMVIVVFGFTITLDLFQQGIRTNTMIEIPRYLLVFIIPLCSLFLALQFLRRFVGWIRQYSNLKR